ncbi:MAG: TolC family protein [Pseudomonadota bacterium]
MSQETTVRESQRDALPRRGTNRTQWVSASVGVSKRRAALTGPGTVVRIPSFNWKKTVFSVALVLPVLLAPQAGASANAGSNAGENGRTGTVADSVPLSMGIEQAVRHGLLRHPSIVAAGHASAAADIRVGETETAWYPRIMVNASYRYAGPISEIVLPLPNGPPKELALGSAHNAATGASAGWRVVDFGARGFRTEAARAAASATKAEGQERSVDLAAAIRSAYLSVLLFDEVRAATGRSLEVARKDLGEQESRRAAGLGSALETAGAEARVADLEGQLAEASENRARALNNLKTMLGLPAASRLELTDSLAHLANDGAGAATSSAAETTAASATPTASAASSAAAAAAGGDGDGGVGRDSQPAEPSAGEHPTIARLAALEQAVVLERKSVARASLPTLDLFGSLQYQFPRTPVESDEAGIAYAAGATLSWDLFDGDLRRRQRQELQARSAEIHALSLAAREQIARQAADASYHRRSALVEEQAAERRLKAAETYLRAAGAALRAGTGTSLDVLRAQEGVDRARLAQLKARFELALARVEELRAEGIAALQAATGPAATGLAATRPAVTQSSVVQPPAIRSVAIQSEETRL